MSLRIRRGTEVERPSRTYDQGELVWTISDGGTGANYNQLWVGNGVTPGGVNILATSAGAGLIWDTNDLVLRVNYSDITTDDIAPGAMLTRQYYDQATAQADAALIFTSGTHSGVTFEYNEELSAMNVTIDSAAFVDSGILAVVNDTTPQLGGNLDLNSYNITGDGSINVTGDLSLIGDILQTGDITTSGSLLSSNADVPDSTRARAPLYVGSNTNPTTLWVNSDRNFGVLNGITDGTNNSGITSRISRGTLSSKTVLQPGDVIVYLEGQGYDGTDFVQAGAIILGVDPAGTITTGNVPSLAGFVTISSAGSPNFMTFNSEGVLSAPRFLANDGSAADPSIAFTTDGGIDTGIYHPGDGIICISTNATERVRVDTGGMRVDGFMKVGGFATGSLPSPAEAGMIVLDTTSGEFKGYNGSAWVVLG